MFTRLLTQPVTIRQRELQPQGGYDDEVLVETGTLATLGYLRPLGGNEDLVEQSTEVRRATLFLDASAIVDADDQIDVAGDTWEISDVDPWVNPRTGQTHHLELQLQLTKG